MDDDPPEVPPTHAAQEGPGPDASSPESSADTSAAGLDFAESDPDLTYHDLSADSLLSNLPRVEVRGLQVPVLHGIPIVRKIGQGGMGAVYLGQKPLLRQLVAVKMLPMQLAQLRPELVERFVREAQLAASIDSPHLVRVSDVGEVSGQFFIVMEFVEGVSAGDLQKRANREKTRIDERVALEICIAATTGLVAAHTQGVIHRDLKPDNVLIPREGGQGTLRYDLAKLVDLGLARSELRDSSLTGSDITMGTPGFMAPEQILAAHRAGKPADVFSMGATLFALLTGRAPFIGENSAAIMMKTLHEPAPSTRDLRPDVSAPTAAVIEQCFQREAGERFPDASALLDALRSCLQALDGRGAEDEALSRIEELRHAPEVGERVAVSSPPTRPDDGIGFPSAGAPRRSGSHRKRLAGLVIIVLLVGIGVVAMLWQRRARDVPSPALDPPVAAITLDLVTSPDRARFMQWATDAFSKTPRGRGVRFTSRTIETQDAAAGFLAGEKLPILWSPTNNLEGTLLRAHWNEAHSGDPFIRSETVSLSPQVFIMYEDRYKAFIDHYGTLGFSNVGDAIASKTWQAIGGPAEWGPFTFALSSRTRSANGLVSAALAAYEVSGDDGVLSRSDVLSDDTQALLKKLDAAFEVSGGGDAIMRDFVLKGPSSYDGVSTEESFAIEYLASAEDRWGNVVIVYPPVNIWNESPIVLMRAEGMSDAQRVAADAFIDFLISGEVQKELVGRGLRPSDPDVLMRGPGSPFVAMESQGIRREIPVTITVSAEVIEALRQ